MECPKVGFRVFITVLDMGYTLEEKQKIIIIPFLQVFTRKLVYGTDMIPESLENSGFPAIATD